MAQTTAEATEMVNKETVRRAFGDWAAGGTRFFDILADDVVWTIAGSGPSAQTFRSKADFIAKAVTPFGARLAVPLRPTVRAIYADGDEVVTLWDGIAQTRDGRTYRNSYAWFFTMRGGRVTAARVARQYATNVFGLFNVTRAALPQMRAQRSGHILNISSIGGVVGFGGACAYTSTKFAVEGFSEDLALDLKPFGIHVTIVEPGFFRTDFLDQSSVKYGDIELDDYAEADRKQREQYGAHSHRQLGDPEKLAVALVKVVAEAEPPLRLALGSDAVTMTRSTLEKRLAELDRWRDLSESTDHDNAPAADHA